MGRLYEHLRNGNILTLVGGLMFLFAAWQSRGFMGGGDTFAHFLISKYALIHPELFFDHWGKPLFTIASSLFAQLGIKGMVLFNVLCAVLTVLVLLLDVRTKQETALGVFALILAPYYTSLHISGLTEPLFALMLCISVISLINKRYLFSALLTGSLLFVRTEGILFVGMASLIFLFYKKYYALLCLILPFLAFSIVGGIIKQGEFFWFFTEMPYGLNSSYELGSLWHFVRKADLIFGYPLLILGSFGMFLVLKDKRHDFITKVTLVGYPLVYFGFHSVLYGLGLGASAGLTRVMLVIMPLLAMTTGIGLSALFQQFIKWRNPTAGVFILAVLAGFFTSSRMPVSETNSQKLVKQVSTDLSLLNEGTIYYFHPAFAVYMKCDPFEEVNCFSGYPDAAVPGDILIWDSHFGPGEGGTPVEVVINDLTWNQEKSYTEGNAQVILFRKVKGE